MRNVKNRGLSLLLVLVLLLGLLPGAARAAEEGVTITFLASSSVEGFYVPRRELKVLPGTAQQYGYVNGAEVAHGQVTLLDALVQAHVDKYGQAFTQAEDSVRRSYLDISDSGFVQTAFGNTDASYSIQLVNGGPLGNATVATAVLREGDVVENLYPDPDSYGMDTYAYFSYESSPVTELTVVENTPVTLALMGDMAYKKTMPSYYGTYEPQVLSVEGGTVFPVLADGSLGAAGEQVIEADGTVTFTLPQGEYTFTVQGIDEETYCFITCPWITLHVVAEDGQDRRADNLAANLTWEVIRGENLRMDGVTSNLVLPASFMGESLTWSCDDQSGALSIYGETGYVSMPLSQDVPVVLTASMDGGTPVKTFPLTVKAEGVTDDKAGVTSYAGLMAGIAQNYTDYDVYTSAMETNDLPWIAMDLVACGGLSLSGDSGELTTYYQSRNLGEAKYVLAELARGGEVTAEAEALKGQDLGAYYIYSAPYVLLALDGARVEDSALEGAVNTRQNLVERIASYLTDPASYLSADVVGPALAALAAYQTDAYPQARAAVEAGVAWLSRNQRTDGSWDGNAEATAMAIVGLSALGIDAHTDSRFIKDGTSGVEGLLSFALADNSGFGHMGNVTYNAMATEQGFRALVAYARMQEGGAPYNIYLLAGDSQGTVIAPDITATVTPGDGDSGEEDKDDGGITVPTVRVTVSVMVPPEGGAEGQYTYRYDSALYSNLLGSAQTQTVPLGTTAQSVLTSALSEAGISYRQSGGYFTAIGGLEEGDHGPNSGWQYLVNGTAPLESASTYTFFSNATLVWYYTDDYTREESAESWESGGEKEEKPEADKEVQITSTGDGAYRVTLPQDSTGPLLVAIPDVGRGDVVVTVGADGVEKPVKKSAVLNGTAYLLLEEDAKVKVVDYAGGFADVAGDAWYAGAVDFVAGRGLFSGVGGAYFAPHDTLNRGMVVTVLYALEDGAAQNAQTLFADVAQDAWYAWGTAWAVEAGIVSGYGDGRFGPEDAVTREQLALMLYRYAQNLGKEPQDDGALENFQDSAEISAWAVPAMSWAVGVGILSGGTDGCLNPGGSATRAEAAAMVRQFVSWMLQN